MDLRLAIGEHAGVLLEQERVVRILEHQDRLAGSEALDVDRLALARAFRGDEDSVRERQARYLAHFEGASSVLDIGCGRGEFLELLRDAGIDARGVDEDGHAVEHCRAKGLDVIRRNGISVLEESTDGSLGGIFAAQVIEHLPPSALLRLVRQARRALAPGGVLLLESVNPETLLNFAEFYIDPTHIRPYHPRLLLWLFEQEGFVDVQADSSVDPDPTFKLPPLSSAGLDAPEFDAALDRLNALLYGRLAYAVIGRAPASAA
jgi:O-antigen chain-terminating methyltransferase